MCYIHSLHPATDGYPLALLPIGNKALLSYQIEYLERNGVNKIIVVIERRFMSKLDKYFNNFFKPMHESTEVELVAISDEEESGNVLKLLKDRITVRTLGVLWIIERLHRALRGCLGGRASRSRNLQP